MAEQTPAILLPLAFQGDVFFYYGLKNFHQNLRRYMDSRDDAQTLGWESKLKVQTFLFLDLNNQFENVTLNKPFLKVNTMVL